MTLNKEVLADACAEKIKQLEFSVKQSAFGGVRQELETELAIARVALLALRDWAEPAAGENLPCPFCGGACDPTGWLSEQTSGPECENCGATAENIEAWNRRTAPPAPVALRERAAPVAYIIQDKYQRESGEKGHLSHIAASQYISDKDICEHQIICTPLFKDLPAIPEEWDFQNTIVYRQSTGRNDAWSAMWGWNAYRAAMLAAPGKEG